LLACFLGGHGNPAAFLAAGLLPRTPLQPTAHGRATLMPRAASGTASEPWKPLVFKMPRKRAARELLPGEDGFTKHMRKRLEDLKLKQEKSGSEARAVSETKVDDLIAQQAEEAVMDAKTALWRMDREVERRYAEETNPDKEVLRERYVRDLARLEEASKRASAGASKAARKTSQAKPQATPGVRSRGFVELSAVQDVDQLMAAASAKRVATPKRSEEELLPEAVEESKEEIESSIQYLESLQKRYKTEDRVSRRVVKSPEERREDYEQTKLRMFAATTAIGVGGTAFSSMMYGTNEAFSFGLGAIAAVQYLSGLSSYTDNAENPAGLALGGRRFLAPVLLVLLVIQWYKLEAQFPSIAALHLEPVLPFALLGFFTYNIGKVIGEAFPHKS